jgi:hypothetical protein
MATTPHSSNTDCAQKLLDWLAGLPLPPRAINPLLRDLEVLLGQRDDATGKSGVLVGVDQAQFVAELYGDEGGLIRRVPSVGALAIEALREAIPPPSATSDTPSADEGWRAFTIDDLVSPLSEDEGAPETQAIAPEVIIPVPAPKRRGRPRRADGPSAVPAPQEYTTQVPAASADSAAAPTKRRGRPRRSAGDLADPVAPPVTVAAPTPPAVSLPTAPADAPPELDEAQLRQLWRQLHPQGRRAVLGFIAEQLIVP